MNRFRGVVIMVTHDRYFLDRVTNKILEISHGKLYSYVANYSKFLEIPPESVFCLYCLKQKYVYVILQKH